VPPSTLPKHAQEIYLAAEENAKKTTCKDRADKDACASKIAWSAVKRKYSKGADGKWHAKSEAEVEFNFTIVKAAYDKATGEMRWNAVASDTDEDLYAEKMSLALFNDFIRRSSAKEAPPIPFCTESWCGGLPYVSVAHYPDLGGKGIAGDVAALYVDGNRLKAKGTFRDTPIGRACFRSVCESLYKEDADQEKVRISIAFLDWKHSHGGMVFERKTLSDKCSMCSEGSGGKTYLAGLLIHLGLTRVPVNDRTDIEAEVDKSMAIVTRKDDAASIIGEELAEELNEEAKKALVGKSDAVVERAEDAEEESECECPEDAIPVVEEAKTKTVGGESFPSSDFLVVEEADKPSTWHLQVKKHGKPDHGLMGAAKAALTSEGGHRGNKYEGPNKAEATRKLKALYKSEKMEWKSEAVEESEVEPEKSEPVPVVVVDEVAPYRPYGGATTFADFDKWQTVQEEKWQFQDAWYTFQTLSDNILSDETLEDKPKALAKLMSEFKGRLETKALTILSQLDEIVTIKAERKSIPIEPITPHPLDETYGVLKSAFDATMASEGTPQDRLVTLQESFNIFAESLKSLIIKSSQPEVPVEATQEEQLVTVLEKALHPIYERLDMMNQRLDAQVSASVGVKTVIAQTPPHRAISPALVAKSQPDEKSKSSIRTLVRQSMGLPL
jgi:cation transport regulator